MSLLLLAGIPAGVILLLFIVAMTFRRVVAANEVHIIQTSKKTTSFGKDTTSGNVYYEWPSSLPIIGVTKVVLPVSVFELSIAGYEAYDVGRVPFVVDITSFFRIADTNLAAQRVSSFEDLHRQLEAIVKGAARSILAGSDIEEIMEARSTFGEKFTNEVSNQLKAWGVETVKNIELMDIRDSENDVVIENIMKKKKSLIEKDSRQEVAENLKEAQLKEIEARQEVEVQEQQSNELVGLRTVEANRKVAIAKEEADQTVKEQQRATKEKEMAVLKVQEVKQADIAKEVQIVNANQDKETQVIAAEAELESARLSAEAQLELKRKESEGITLEGTAKADARKAMENASVASQITLAQEIGENEGYQNYLITIRQVESQEAVGIEQAKALTAADIKVIANTDTPTTGINDVSEIFSSKGGQQFGAALEGLKNTPLGGKLLENLGLENTTETTVETPVVNGSGKKRGPKLNANSLNGSGH